MNKVIDIGLIGGRGYVGKELVRLIDKHPIFNLKQAFSRSQAGSLISEYTKNLNLKYLPLSNNSFELDSSVQALILALGNGDAANYMEYISKLNQEIIVIDISSDNRFNQDWLYRLPEITKNSGHSKLLSNPGCYATAIQLSIEPIKNLLVGKTSSFGISGYSGAGSKPHDKNDKNILRENIYPYSLADHLHQEEVRAHCYKKSSFTPHVADFFRGISMTTHIKLKEPSDSSQILRVFKDFYENKPLVKITESIPLVADNVMQHHASIGGFDIDDSGLNLVICCTLDNLLKGAATQCIQNLNYSFQLNEEAGINYE
ncbi:MAG: N-acetyl-gamma-glutamyl-phosphate reductase [Gammaproteobacteria bacterium]|nr:N-acetyl-gamma-glutamyl-phosphate reductase [Gammaproteobacteria bacterium]HJL80475.1 N-acetyl-gamma-glutamyl-phosphate reductase [Gammaproteobacteria bacterium]|tara:strand:+ start:604 stop:1551 length:948 start_codon:yes stop_codon:yes gene_type:complete